MPIREPDDVLLHGLRDMYFAEKRIETELGRMSKEANDPELRQMFDAHRRETRSQVKRLEGAFKSLGEKPRGATCHGVLGLVEERKDMKEKKPTPPLLDFMNLEAAIKTEHYEIAAYESMVDLAERLGHDRARDLLEENLMEERSMLDRVKNLATEFDVEAEPSEETHARSPRTKRSSARGKGPKAKARAR